MHRTTLSVRAAPRRDRPASRPAALAFDTNAWSSRPHRCPTDDDCFAVRLAAALRRRCGDRARPLAAARLSRAIAARETVKADLYLAVTFVLADPDGIFRRSRDHRSGPPRRA